MSVENIIKNTGLVLSIEEVLNSNRVNVRLKNGMKFTFNKTEFKNYEKFKNSCGRP